MTTAPPPDPARKAWLSVLAKSPADLLDRLWQDLGYTVGHSLLRAPETGGVMVRGRAGAVGAAFNLGEVTVTRASVRLTSGEVGHGYVQGRGKAHALTAALVDATMQTAAADTVRAAILEPLEQHARRRTEQRAARAATTKVDFFTLVRGED